MAKTPTHDHGARMFAGNVSPPYQTPYPGARPTTAIEAAAAGVPVGTPLVDPEFYNVINDTAQPAPARRNTSPNNRVPGRQKPV